MSDRFANHAATIDGPAQHAFEITPDDVELLDEVTRGLYVGTGGDLAAIMATGATVSFTNIISGTVLPIRVQAILATGTTASGIVGLL